MHSFWRYVLLAFGDVCKYALHQRFSVKSEDGVYLCLPWTHADLHAFMLGGSFYSDEGAELTANSQPAIDAQWQVGPHYISHFRPELSYGVAPFPPPVDHPERASTAVVQAAVTIIPTGAADKEAAAKLLAWMMSPEIPAKVAYANSSLPTSRTAARNPLFQ
jgi:ABC-type glycerol-3-phosphate transport system substrate-binding protein